MESYISELRGYHEGDTLYGYDKQACTIPMDNKFVVPKGLIKFVQYQARSGMIMVDVFLGIKETDLCHIYTKMIGRGYKCARLLLDTAGIHRLTGKSVKTFPKCVMDYMCSDTNDALYGRLFYLRDLIGCMMASIEQEKQYSTNIDPYLATVDNSEYDTLVRDIYNSMGSLVDICYENSDRCDDARVVLPMRELYTNYLHNCYDCAADPASFNDHPSNINELLMCMETIVQEDRLLTALLDASFNSMYPEDYCRHDYALASFITGDYLYNRSGVVSTIKQVVNFKADEYLPVKEFNGHTLRICYEFMSKINSQFNCKYILSNKACPRSIIEFINVLLYHDSRKIVHASKPVKCEIFKSHIDEMFITIVMANGKKYGYFIDLTLVPLICHGVRYINRSNDK